MKITEMKTSTFWKGELGVQASVEDAGNHYEISLFVKGSQLNGYSCSCVKTGLKKYVMCEHEKFVWEAWQKEQALKNGRPVMTSQEIRTMIREYTNREVAQIVQEGEVRGICLIPRLILKRDGGTSLEFKIGRDRTYVVKDLAEFVHAVESGTQISYGKTLSFHHSLDSFVEEDRPLCAFLMELVNVYQEHFEQFRKSSFVTVKELRELNLSRGNRDRFFKLMEGRELEVEDLQGNSMQMKVREELIPIPVQIERAGRDGVKIHVDENIYGFSGETRWYVGIGLHLMCMEPVVSAQMDIFLSQMLKDRRSHTMEIQDRDMPLFYERVLKKILPYTQMDVKDIDLESYRPQELRASFSFDSPASGVLTMKPVLSYGDFSFQPIEDDKVPRTVCRDVPGEFRISQVITRYFKYQDEQSQTLLIRNDDDAMYRLLNEGMKEFMVLGEVYMSDSAKKIRVLPPPSVEVRVQAQEGWLNLDVEADGMTPEQFQKILAGYDPKKPYYRLKSGEFLRLDAGGMVTVARLVDGLEVDRALLAEGKIRVPAFRALYLNSVLKEGSGITFYRDNLFKALVRGMKSVEDSDYEIPETLRPVLREYQKTGYRWMRTLDAWSFGGILADDMGLGKTIQVITLLLDETQRNPDSAFLIVCPASLVYNWEQEIRRFAPALPVQTVAGNAGEREAVLKEVGPGVLITSYDLLKRDVMWYQDRKFRFQILDEAQYIKNPATQGAKAVKMIQSQTRFALTGTPIENRLSELWSIFEYLMPGFLHTYSGFKKKFELPIVRDGDRRALEDLRRLTGPFILRRMKQDVLKELPEKLETVVYSQAEATQQDLYRASAMQLKEEIQNMDGGIGENRIQILAGLTRLRQICCDPALCYTNYRGASAKLDTCVELIQGGIAGGHKILLFSQFTSMLERIAMRLTKEGISYHMLTGSTPKEERIRLAGAFQSDEVPIFLISLKAGGTGLNLTSADIVIHYDPWWNVAAQNQATDRTHRIGQEKQVSVFKLIMKDTIEESILKLQEQKQDLARQVIEGETLSLTSLSREELLKLLS